MDTQNREYLEKLDYVSDNDIVRATRDGDIKIPKLWDEKRVVGITYASLGSLTIKDWHEWIVDRLLTGRHSDLRSYYSDRDGGYRFLFFEQLVNGATTQIGGTSIGNKIVSKLSKGYLRTIPAFINETIPNSEMEAWKQSYNDARKDLNSMGPMVFGGELIDRLNHHRGQPWDTKEQQAERLREIEAIIKNHSF